MKVEIIDKKYYIFISKFYIKDINYNDRKCIGEVVKDFLFKYKNKFCINGFYKVLVYSSKYIGLFLELYQIEDSDYANYLDLKILVYLDENIYFCCDDYDVASYFDIVYYFDGKFYGLINKDVDISLLEFGKYIYNFNKGILI